MSDYDKQQWQAEQAARETARDKQREKERKARERSARNAQRKLERLHRTLRDRNDLSDFEDEFAESVTERLDKFGSAFHDLEKGRPGDALSFAQKRVVAAMNRKVKSLKKQDRHAQRDNCDEGDADTLSRPQYERPKPRSTFKSKRSAKWTPRVRQLDEDFDADADTDAEAGVFIPEKASHISPAVEDEINRPPVGKPFLRIVK